MSVVEIKDKIMHNRRPTTQDISWIIDLYRNNQLDLDPPYQRRSVWTPRDRQFFLDTIFRNYPSPAIFLHKTIDEMGKTTYHVVDGKQRTETILKFVNNELRMGRDFGDIRLDGKKWGDLQGESELKKRFWDYQLTVEMIDFSDTAQVNAVFDRLNRNSRKLTPQELRHAKYDGWFITEVESEANRDDWRQFGIVTTARAKRMADSQFISELMIVILENRMFGFDQDQLDTFYAKYDDTSYLTQNFDMDQFREDMGRVRDYIKAVEDYNNAVSLHARALAHFYTLWSVIALNQNLPEVSVFAGKYESFITKVELLYSQEDASPLPQGEDADVYKQPFSYLKGFRGANTDLAPRETRYYALRAALLD
jgi:hypothetical protein